MVLEVQAAVTLVGGAWGAGFFPFLDLSAGSVCVFILGKLVEVVICGLSSMCLAFQLKIFF